MSDSLAYLRQNWLVFLAGLLVVLLLPFVISGEILATHVVPSSGDYCVPRGNATEGRAGSLFDFELRNGGISCRPHLANSYLAFSILFLGLALPTAAVYSLVAWLFVVLFRQGKGAGPTQGESPVALRYRFLAEPTVALFRRHKARVFVGLLVSLMIPAGFSGHLVTDFFIPERYAFCSPHDGERGLLDFEWRSSGTFCTPHLLPSYLLFAKLFFDFLVPTIILYSVVVLAIMGAVGKQNDTESTYSPRLPEPLRPSNGIRSVDRSRNLRSWILGGLLACLVAPAILSGRVVASYDLPNNHLFCEPHDGSRGVFDLERREKGTFCTPAVFRLYILFSSIFTASAAPIVFVYGVSCFVLLPGFVGLSRCRPGFDEKDTTL